VKVVKGLGDKWTLVVVAVVIGDAGEDGMPAVVLQGAAVEMAWWDWAWTADE